MQPIPALEDNRSQRSRGRDGAPLGSSAGGLGWAGQRAAAPSSRLLQPVLTGTLLAQKNGAGPRRLLGS